MIERSGLRIFCILVTLFVISLFIFISIAPILLIFALFTAYFFRDPERKIGEGVISPADGRIDYIEKGRMEIFMSPFDCHVNRSPVSGTVLKTEFKEGKV